MNGPPAVRAKLVPPKYCQDNSDEDKLEFKNIGAKLTCEAATTNINELALK